MSKNAKNLIMDTRRRAVGGIAESAGKAVLFCITAIPTVAVVFIIFFIAKEALPFFGDISHLKEFFTSADWRPSADPNPHFGALSIFYGTAMVTAGSCAVAVPLGILTAVCLNEIVGSKTAGFFKPLVELLAAVPSVAYGFFAIIVFAPLLQNHGGAILSALLFAAGVPVAAIAALPVADFVSARFTKNARLRKISGFLFSAVCAASVGCGALSLSSMEISSGTNALNASIILAIMALPTIVSISQDALASVGRDMREGSLALGATRFETIFKVVLPCAKSGIAVAVILGLMRVVGETMVVWMASGNSLKIPEPFYNFFEPVRTLTATIAGEMGEADQSTGSARYHVLFAMSFCLLAGGLALNAASQWVGSGFKFRKK